MPKALNPNRAKIHRSYSVEEVANLYEVHKGTVRSWIKDSLPLCGKEKPMLIHGGDLREYVRAKRVKHKQKCKPWEFYCMRCRKPQFPAGGMAEYESQTATKGRLIALCPECDVRMNKYTSPAKLEQLEGKLEVSIPKALKRINDRA